MSRIFGYYDDWKTARLTCDGCGWEGTFEEGLVEEYDQLMDCACPNCGGAYRKILAIVSFPTLAESRKNWEKLPDIEKDYVVTLEEIREVARSTRPLTVDNLPDIPDEKITLIWELEEDERGIFFTVIKTQSVSDTSTEIHREVACWEGFTRFEQVARILRQKYGTRLADIVPTPAGDAFLCGDNHNAHDHVTKVRDSIRKSIEF